MAQRKIVALVTIMMSGTRYTPNSVVEMDEVEAESLIAQNFARAHDEVDEKPAEMSKAEKAAAEKAAKDEAAAKAKAEADAAKAKAKADAEASKAKVNA